MHRSALLLLLSAVALPTATGALDEATALVSFSAGMQKLGVFFSGDLKSKDKQDPDFDLLLMTVDAGETKSQSSKSHHSFTVRSADMAFRAKITVYDNTGRDRDNHPFKIAFKNLMLEAPGKSIELKHSNSGFLWIEPGDEVTHNTDVNHEFELRDLEHDRVIAVRLDFPSQEL
jgi:hypothetical protein